MKIIFCVVVVSLFVVAIAIARYSEAKQFNRGKCRKCNRKLRSFSTDSQGGRGYICDKCGYTVWVSYKVDKHYTE